jgi:sugar phosphate isomerase/epimerase
VTDKRLALAGSSFGWLYQTDLQGALARMSAVGITSFELTTAAPHVGPTHDPGERQRIRDAVGSSGLAVLSVNPTFVDINLVSSDPVFREVSAGRIRSEIELAADLGARIVVIMAGRRHALYPAPVQHCLNWLHEALDVLLPAAQREGVVLSLENSPYGYMGRSEDILAVLQARNSPNLRATYDVANALAVEDPACGVTRLAGYIALAHVSDAWRDRWAHTSPGRGEVDFPAFASALRSIGFTGPTVYELADGEPVDPRLPRDLAAFTDAGWDLTSHAALPII